MSMRHGSQKLLNNHLLQLLVQPQLNHCCRKKSSQTQKSLPKTNKKTPFNFKWVSNN